MAQGPRESSVGRSAHGRRARRARRWGPGAVVAALAGALIAAVGPVTSAAGVITAAGVTTVGTAGNVTTAGPVVTAAEVTTVGTAGTVTTAVDLDEKVLCTFDTGTLGEVSGLTLSRLHPGVVWATNDSGGGPYLYAIDTSDCRIRATLHLLDTPARDHEALASGVDARGRAVIWIADIGDNLGGWAYARIHKVREPKVLADADVPVTTYRYTYPDGPRNAEALLAMPDREQLWVVSKESAGAAMYALPSPMSDSLTPMTATQVGSARSLITDGAVSPDGTRYVLRDYFSAEVFDGEPPGTAVSRFRLPIQPQGEAITWTADGQSLIVASEGSGDLIQVKVPASALGADEGIATVLPRVAGFDVYPYLRLAVMVVVLLVALIWLPRRARRRDTRR